MARLYCGELLDCIGSSFPEKPFCCKYTPPIFWVAKILAATSSRTASLRVMNPAFEFSTFTVTFPESCLPWVIFTYALPVREPTLTLAFLETSALFHSNQFEPVIVLRDKGPETITPSDRVTLTLPVVASTNNLLMVTALSASISILPVLVRKLRSRRMDGAMEA